MSRVKIFKSLNKVFELMMANKLREDMDDTLLEKLFSIIKLKISHDCTDSNGSKESLACNIHDLLQNTHVLHLAVKVIISIDKKSEDLSPSIQKFTIELIGMLFGNKEVFLAYQDCIFFRELSKALLNGTYTAYLPTVQSALLLCCINITRNFEGVMWFKDKRVIQFVFSSFPSSSYYVRAKAVLFITKLLSMWTSLRMSSLSTEEQLLLNNFFESIVRYLITGIKLDGTGIKLDSIKEENYLVDSCRLALINSVETANVRKLVNSSSALKEQFLHYFGSLTKSDIVDEKVLNLLLDVFISGGVSDLFIQDILKLLTSHLLFPYAIDLVGSVLRVSNQNQPISKQDIQFLILPLKILSGNHLLEYYDGVLGFSCPEMCSNLFKAIESKPDCIKIVISCLLSLSKLTNFMNPEVLEDVLTSISIVVTGPTSSQHHPMSYVGLENRKICFALAELFTSLLNETVYATIKYQNQLDLTNYLMHCIEKPFDYNVATELLKLLGSVINLNEKLSVALPEDMREKVMHLLCKKLMDKTEAIVICALSVASLIMSNDENKFWKDIILKQNLHQIVWEMGVEGVQDGMLKGASLQATLQACKVPHFWEDIQMSKKVNEEDVMMIFCRYYRDPDFYVQREALACIFEWLKVRESTLPLTCKDPVLVILSEAAKSLDMDQKDMALKAWDWLLESEKFFPKAMESVDSLLKAVCESGFASSLILGIEDYDEAVQYKAAEILIKFRDTLQKMGCSAEYSVVDEMEWNLPETRVLEELSFEPISKEERDAGIENVLRWTTAEQITKLVFVPDIASDNLTGSDPFRVDSLAIPVSSFLKYIWSSSLDCIVSKPAASTDLFSEHTLSLLDDIIASDVKGKGDCCPLDDTPDCY